MATHAGNSKNLNNKYIHSCGRICLYVQANAQDFQKKKSFENCSSTINTRNINGANVSTHSCGQVCPDPVSEGFAPVENANPVNPVQNQAPYHSQVASFKTPPFEATHSAQSTYAHKNALNKILSNKFNKKKFWIISSIVITFLILVAGGLTFYFVSARNDKYDGPIFDISSLDQNSDLLDNNYFLKGTDDSDEWEEIFTNLILHELNQGVIPSQMISLNDIYVDYSNVNWRSNGTYTVNVSSTSVKTTGNDSIDIVVGDFLLSEFKISAQGLLRPYVSANTDSENSVNEVYQDIIEDAILSDLSSDTGQKITDDDISLTLKYGYSLYSDPFSSLKIDKGDPDYDSKNEISKYTTQITIKPTDDAPTILKYKNQSATMVVQPKSYDFKILYNKFESNGTPNVKEMTLNAKDITISGRTERTETIDQGKTDKVIKKNVEDAFKDPTNENWISNLNTGDLGVLTPPFNNWDTTAFRLSFDIQYLHFSNDEIINSDDWIVGEWVDYDVIAMISVNLDSNSPAKGVLTGENQIKISTVRK